MTTGGERMESFPTTGIKGLEGVPYHGPLSVEVDGHHSLAKELLRSDEPLS